MNFKINLKGGFILAGFKNIEKGKVFSLLDLIDYKTHRVISLTLCDSETLRIVLFSFDKDEAITEEQTQNAEQFTLLEGKMEFVIEGKKFMLEENDSIIINPDQEHSLLALTPCKMLQTSLK